MFPQVHAALKGRLIIERVAAVGEYGIAQTRGIHRQARNAVAAVLQVKLQRCHGRLFLVSAFFLLAVLFLGVFVGLLFLGLFFLFLFGLLLHDLLLLGHLEVLIGVKVKEHDVDIVLGAPAAVAAVTGAVAGENHRLATQHPFAVALIVAALGQVVDLAVAAGVDQCDILAVPTALADVGREQPTAVGTPFKPHVAVTVGIDVLAVHQGAHNLALDVNGPQCAAVFQEGNTLAVGAVFGLQ